MPEAQRFDSPIVGVVFDSLSFSYSLCILLRLTELIFSLEILQISTWTSLLEGTNLVKAAAAAVVREARRIKAKLVVSSKEDQELLFPFEREALSTVGSGH